MCVYVNALLMAPTLTLIDHHSPSWFMCEYLSWARVCVCVCGRTYACERHWACTFVSSSSSEEAVNQDISGHERKSTSNKHTHKREHKHTHTELHFQTHTHSLTQNKTSSVTRTDTAQTHTQSANKHSCIYVQNRYRHRHTAVLHIRNHWLRS